MPPAMSSGRLRSQPVGVSSVARQRWAPVRGTRAAPVRSNASSGAPSPQSQHSGMYYGSGAGPQQNYNSNQSYGNMQPRQVSTPQPLPHAGFQQQQQPYAQPYGQPGAGASAPVNLDSVPRVRPAKEHINSVVLLGTVRQPQRQPQARAAHAMLEVPFSTKPGGNAFTVEAWDVEAAQLMVLEGQRVVVEGRLSADEAFGFKVVAHRITLVDTSLPPTQIPAARYSAPGGGGVGRSRLVPEKVWRTHYDTRTRTCKELSAHFGCAESSVQEVLLSHAFKTNSPLRWRELAEEKGLPREGLEDFMGLVSQYKEEMAAMAAAAQPGAQVPPLPVTLDGMLKVRPIRDWARAKDKDSVPFYAVNQLEAARGLGVLYDVLRLAVVAEATQGAWDYDTEFGAPRAQE